MAFGSLAVLLLPGMASAAAGQPPTKGITITPFLQKVSIAGFEASKTFTVQVTNHTTATRNFTVSAADFGSLNETGGIAFQGLRTDYSKQHGLSNWLSIDKLAFTLSPNQSVTLTGTIRNDTSLAPGGHYGAILVNEVTAGRQQSNSVATQPTVSSLVFADKLGGESYDLHLASFTQNGNWFHLPSGVTLRFNAPGNVEVTPRGTIDLVDKHNKLIKRGVINEESGLVLPGTYRQIHVTVNAVSSTGWWPAHYTLAVHYRYDGITQVATKQVQLMYWNLPHLILLILILTGVAATIHRIYRLRLWKTIRQPLKHH